MTRPSYPIGRAIEVLRYKSYSKKALQDVRKKTIYRLKTFQILQKCLNFGREPEFLARSIFSIL